MSTRAIIGIVMFLVPMIGFGGFLLYRIVSNSFLLGISVIVSLIYFGFAVWLMES